MNYPKGVKLGVRQKWAFPASHVAPVTIHSKTTGNQSYVTVGELTLHTYVTQKWQIYENGLYGDHRISEKLSEVSVKNIPASIILKPE